MKKILEEIARQLRTTLPFAIVDNGTWTDGTYRGKSWFSKILCYDSIQAAIDDEHSMIKIKTGLYEPFIIRESSNYGRAVFNIEGSGYYPGSDKKGTLIDGSTKSPAILADAGGGSSYTDTVCNLYISNLMVRTTQGGGSTYSAIDIRKMRQGVFLSNVAVIGSDANGMSFSSCNIITIEDCDIRNTDGHGIYIDHPQFALSSNQAASFHKVIRCIIESCAGSGIFVNTAQGTSTLNGFATFFRNNYIRGCSSTGIYLVNCGGVKVVSNFIQSCVGWGIDLTSTSNKCLAAGNVLRGNTAGAVTNQGTNNVVADNVSA